MKTKFVNRILFILLTIGLFQSNYLFSQKISIPRQSEILYTNLFENNSLLKNPIKPTTIDFTHIRQLNESKYLSKYYKSSNFYIKPLINNTFYNGFIETRNGIRLISSFNKFSIDFSYTNNKNSLPEFAKNKIDSTRIIPHFAKAKKKDGYYGFHYFVGELLYNPSKYITLSLGNKHTFLGNGNRSLFLSDNSGNYLSLKAYVNIWNIDYLFQTSFLQDIHNLEQPYNLKKKYGTFHYISWDVTPKFNLNFFEAVIWAPDDSTTNRGYDINYLNPVVFLRPVEFSVGSPDNVLLGIGGNVEIFKNTLIYSQFILDEFNLTFIRETEKWWANKFGYQFGIKYWKTNQESSLILSLEHNWMRPFTFSHAYSSKSYGNMLQPLAHPLGANFREWISSINYSKNKIFVENIFAFQQYGSDSLATNYGNNIYKSNLNRSLDYGSEILQGIENNVIINQLTISYLLIPKWFSFIDLGFTYRNHRIGDINNNDLFISIGVRTGFNRRNIFDSRY